MSKPKKDRGGFWKAFLLLAVLLGVAFTVATAIGGAIGSKVEDPYIGAACSSVSFVMINLVFFIHQIPKRMKAYQENPPEGVPDVEGRRATFEALISSLSPDQISALRNLGWIEDAANAQSNQHGTATIICDECHRSQDATDDFPFLPSGWIENPDSWYLCPECAELGG